MNSIPIVQNEPNQLRKLLVEDKNYSRAKLWHGLQIFLVVFAAAALSLAAVKCESWGPAAAIYGAFVTLVDFFLFDPKISKLKQRAASVRECFDVDVLQLDTSPFREADVPIEDVMTIPDPVPLAKKKNKVDWYPLALKDLPIEAARLICQRSSMQYDARLRDSYRYLWLGILTILAAGFAYWLISRDPTFYRIAIVASAVLPAALFCIKQNQLNEEASSKIADLRKYFDSTWSTALAANVSGSELTKSARHIQDQLFDHRGQRPLVPNFYYKMQRTENERIMNDSAQVFVNKYKTAHNLP